MTTPAMLLCDFYKLSHREQYPKETEVVYSTWIPRSNKYHNTADKVIAFGFQGFIKKYLIDYFNTNFFRKPIDGIIKEYKRFITSTLGTEDPDTAHISELWELGYLPLSIKALPEGTSAPIGVPLMTIQNTKDRFFWVTNYIESLMSSELWLPTTSATVAKEYKDILTKYAIATGGDIGFIPFQAHDFSMRGMGSLESAKTSGAGHLLSFTGTDNIPAIFYLEKYYNANIEKELVGTSIPATEHSVMCVGSAQTNEFELYKRLITEVYPNGFLSIVSDTWDLWACIREIIKPLKDEIMGRDGRVVLRPDSGNPYKILCGDIRSDNLDARKGVIKLLWDIFGGTINEKGYKVLDSHIGTIYGDAINLATCEKICIGLKDAGFASTNVVFGIGSYAYQFNTRDSFGFAMKSTACKVGGKEMNIFKDPITDDGAKKSKNGVVAVIKDGKSIKCIDGLKFNHTENDLLREIFLDGHLIIDDTLDAIRKRIQDNV